MNLTCLEYHDVVENREFSSSGFNTPGAELYKMDRERFKAHLQAFANSSVKFPKIVDGKVIGGSKLLTFDDGGVAAFSVAARLLEEFQFSACFLMATGQIGESGFLSAQQIRQLENAGHCVGSHTDSHPLRMAALRDEEIDREWKISTDKLAQVTGHSTRVASISGGQYSRRIARSADANGIRLLFTSEPTSRCFFVGDCLVVGRYTIKQNDEAHYASRILTGHRLPRYKQWMAWNAKKLLKKSLGSAYIRVRARILD